MGRSVAGQTPTPPKRTKATRKPGAGRRRDPTIDDRLRQAARTLYAREGWAGFHFDGVARAAGVSKDAVYRRYSDAESLLLDALSDKSIPALADDGPVEAALVAFACDAFTYFSGGDGYANLRVHVDGLQYPTVLQAYRSRVVEPHLAKAVAILERAQVDGRLHSDASPAAVIEAISGAVMMHTLSVASQTDTGIPEAVARQFEVFVQQILHGRVKSTRP